MTPNSRAYNEYFAIRWQGPLHIPALEKAINEIQCCHETLRTTFHNQKGQAVAIIEAMKMENKIFASAPGVVESIKVKTSQAVTVGEALLTIK